MVNGRDEQDNDDLIGSERITRLRDKLNQFRDSRQLSFAQLAQMSGINPRTGLQYIHRSTIQGYLEGRSYPDGISIWQGLANIFNTTIDALKRELEGDDYAPSDLQQANEVLSRLSAQDKITIYQELGREIISDYQRRLEE